MSDFEKRLSDALAAGADGAPDAGGLADGARGRARRRRRTTAALAAAAVVAVVAVPVGVVALRDGADPSSSDTATDPMSPDGSLDGRVESWRDAEIRVPADWQYGSLDDWCIAGGKPDVPVVSRPGGVSRDIGCSPRKGYGVEFHPPDPGATYQGSVQQGVGREDDYPDGAWVGAIGVSDGVAVTVVSPDQEVGMVILDSARQIEDVDGNGCPAQDEGEALDRAEQMSVCRYSADGWLDQSEKLSKADTAAARAALDAAPIQGAADDCANPPGEHVVMSAEESSADVQWTGQPCSDRGLFLDGQVRELTEDVMYWALSPGWTGDAGNAPLPDQLRELPAAAPIEPAAESPCPDGVYANSVVRLDVDNGEPMTVCRFEVDWDAESGGSRLLADTTMLTDAESSAVRAAVGAAPAQKRSDFRSCNEGPGEFFLVLAGDQVSLWVYNAECGDHGVLLDGGEREVTQELLDALGSPYGLLR